VSLRVRTSHIKPLDVWADFGQTDSTIQFRLIPDGHGYRVELDDMHVM